VAVTKKAAIQKTVRKNLHMDAGEVVLQHLMISCLSLFSLPHEVTPAQAFYSSRSDSYNEL
jgi:hypothetical protein